MGRVTLYRVEASATSAEAEAKSAAWSAVCGVLIRIARKEGA